MIPEQSSTSNISGGESSPAVSSSLAHYLGGSDSYDPQKLIVHTQPRFDDMGWLIRQMAQVCLPLRNPGKGKTEWIRENGSVTLRITAGFQNNPQTGKRERILPYGKFARAGLLYMMTEAHRTGEPRIEFGNSNREFMDKLGLEWGGKSGRLLCQQMNALIGCQMELFDANFKKIIVDGEEKSISFSRNANFQFSNYSELWTCVSDDPDQLQIFDSYVVLSDGFMTMLKHSLPVDLRAWKWLNQNCKSAMPLDVYLWVAERAWRAKSGGDFVSWEQLMVQFGSQGRKSKFIKIFLNALHYVQQIYPQLIIKVVKEGVIVYHSPAAVHPGANARALRSY